MNNGLAVSAVCALMLAACPIDRLEPPHFESRLDTSIEVRIHLVNGAVRSFTLHPGDRLLHTTEESEVERILFLSDLSVIEDLDRADIERMRACTEDPREVTWYVESAGVRASVPCGNDGPGQGGEATGGAPVPPQSGPQGETPSQAIDDYRSAAGRNRTDVAATGCAPPAEGQAVRRCLRLRRAA